jgi:hypothetical protein
MHPEVEGGDCQQCLQARRHTLPADHQATRLRLEPGTGACGWASCPHCCARSAPRCLGLPDPLRALCPQTSPPELLPHRFGLIPCRRRPAREAWARTASLAWAHLDGLKPRQSWRPRVSRGWGGPVGQGPAAAVRAAGEQAPLALPALGAARAASLPRGTTRSPQRQTPSGAAPVPRHSRASGPASHATGQPRASVGTRPGARWWTPRAVPAGPRPSASRSASCPATYALSAATGHAAPPARASAAPEESYPRTSATPNPFTLQSVLPYCPPTFREHRRAEAPS